jgi:tetraprenyl-beta-curcumene synthase
MAALARSLALYRSAILPAVDRELAGWETRAAAIPGDALRRAALAALEKRANVEATAVFATLAPQRGRRTVVRASVALQVAVDYLDVLSERGGPDALEDSLRLHRALPAALDPGGERADWYASHPDRDDGGYLDQLVASCRAAVAALPAAAVVLPVARRAAARCGEGQSQTHAAADGPAGLEAWAAGLGSPPELRWWEAAAGASSSAAAHALLALAATPGAGAGEAELVLDAYDPWVGALTVLLDDLVDRDADRDAGEHSYLAYYDDATATAGRLDLIATRAGEALQRLRRPRGHEAILVGVLAFYLGSAGSDPVAERIRAARQPAVRLLSTLLRFA